ncbi:MAG: IPT/TIG domain-containing protein, partial [Gammaproteobacteria bacterium]|nr:IPT/TIG domain-containing protein [Gammaproteobacteria bacterium]
MRNHDPCKSILPRLMMVGAFALLLSACGGGGGGGDGGEVDNPTPVADGITPSEVRAKGSGTGFTAQAVAPGGSDLTLMVTGSDFVEGAVVRWNGQARETTFGSASELTATIWAADLAVPGEAYVTVFNPEPAGGESAALEFTITNPLPVSDTTSPNAAFAGGAGFGLTVTGRDFVEGAAVRWNGADQATTYISSSELSAAIDATAIATAGAANVSVSNPGPGGGESGLLTFAINNPPPSIAELLPNISPQGGASFFLTVNGTGFVWNSVVRWNGQIRATTFIDASRLTAVINATDIASAGVATVDVVSPAPGGGTSNAQIVTISDTAPTTTGIMPGNAVAGGGQFDLTVDGTNFNIGSVVRWNGANRTTTYVSATELRATIDAADIASAGTAIVAVERPGSGVSNPQFFTIANPQPVGGALVPASMVRDSGGFTLI